MNDANALYIRCLKIEHIYFRFFSRYKNDHMIFPRNAPLLCTKTIESGTFRGKSMGLVLNKKGMGMKITDFGILTNSQCFLGHFMVAPV